MKMISSLILSLLILSPLAYGDEEFLSDTMIAFLLVELSECPNTLGTVDTYLEDGRITYTESKELRDACSLEVASGV